MRNIENAQLAASNAHRHPVPQRDLDFGIGEDLPKHWHSDSPHITHLFNGLSILFPQGERFFIRSVRRYRDRISEPELQEQVAGFIAQEAMHGREHQAYNDALKAQGYPVAKLEAREQKLLAFGEKHFGGQRLLSATIIAEHFTAILAHQLLSKPTVFEGADPRMRRLWLWHALEETEHKAVAFDVYQTAFADKPVKRYRVRALMLFLVSMDFWTQTFWNQMVFLKHDGQLWNVRGWLKFWYWALIKPGLFRRAMPDWFAWYRPSFHPWDKNNKALMQRLQREYRCQR